MSDVTVELRLRRGAPTCTARAEDRLVSRVTDLEDRPHVGAVRIETWDRVRVQPARDAGQLSLIQQFARWADRQGLSLEPAFRRRDASTFLDTRDRVEIVVPVASLAVWEGAELCCVTPCSNGERVETVWDALARLERGEVRPDIEPHGSPDEATGLVDLTA